MIWTFFICTGLNLVIFLIGFIWILATRGKVQRRSGDEVGKEVMSTQMDDAVYFKGKATMVEREASVGLDDIKTAFKTKDWGTLTALLMLVGGFLGLCLCGGLSVLSML